MLTADESGKAFVWNVSQSEKLTHLELKKHERKISAARFSKDSTQLLLGFPGRKIGLWSVKSGKIEKSWLAPERSKGWVPQGSTIYDVAFNSGETEVIAESSNGIARSWAISGGG